MLEDRLSPRVALAFDLVPELGGSGAGAVEHSLAHPLAKIGLVGIEDAGTLGAWLVGRRLPGADILAHGLAGMAGPPDDLANANASPIHGQDVHPSLPGNHSGSPAISDWMAGS